MFMPDQRLIYCIKNDSRIETPLRFLQYLLLFAGNYGILKKRIRRISVHARAKDCVWQSGVSAEQKKIRKILCMTSVKGYRYRQRHSRSKTGVAKPDGPKRKVFSPHGSRLPKVLCTPLQSYARCKGGILFGD